MYFEDVLFRSEHDVHAVLPDRSGANGTTFDLFNHTTWKCDRKDGQKIELTDFGFPGKQVTNLAPSYFAMMLDPCGIGRALVQRNVTSLNPNLALRNTALDKCFFSPFTELNAMRWSSRARLEWSEALTKSLELVKYGNQTYLIRGYPPSVPDPVAARPFLPDTLKRLTIKRTNDGSHPSKTWRGKPVIKGFLPSEWALLSNLEYLDLSDDMGQGLIEGPIPSTWLMMTKLRTINVTGHRNFCKDWHRIVSYQIQSFIQRTPYGAVWGLPKRYYGPILWTNKAFQWNVTVFNLDGLGWQWYDPSTGKAGYTNIIAPDGKCCWDTFSDQFEARNYTLEGPSGTSGPWDYYGLSYERAQLCEWSAPYMPPSATNPPAPPVAPMPPDVPSAPPVPPAAAAVTIVSPPRPPLFPPLPGISPMLPYAPPQPPQPPGLPAHLQKRLRSSGALQPDRPEPPDGTEFPAGGPLSPSPSHPPFPSPTPHPTLRRPPTTPFGPQHGERRPSMPFPSPAPSSPYPPPKMFNPASRSPKSIPPPAPPLTKMPNPPPLDKFDSQGEPTQQQPPYFNCSLAITQASFAIPSVSRGSFYIVLSVPQAASVYCMFCGCSVMYAVLERGVSYLYAVHENPEAQIDDTTTTAAAVSPPSHPPLFPSPVTTHPPAGSPNRSSKGGSTGDGANNATTNNGTRATNVNSSLLSGILGRHGNNDSIMFSNTTALPPSQRAGQNVSRPFLPSLEDLVMQGASAPGSGRGSLEEVDIVTGIPLRSPPPRNPFNATVFGNSSSGGNNGAPGRAGDGGTTTVGDIGAAWRMDPESNGDHLFRIQVGERVWYRWVVVDIESPRVSGQLSISKTTVTMPGLVTSRGSVSSTAVFQQLIVQFNVSEPVQPLDPASMFSVNGTKSVAFVGAKCFESAADASKLTSGRVVGTAGLPLSDSAGRTSAPTKGSAINLLDFLEGTTTDEALASGLPYVRSCVAVMYAPEGSTLLISLRAGAVKDFAGNSNAKPVVLKANTLGPALESADAIAGSVSALVGGIFAGAAISSTSVSFLTTVTTRAPILQSAYHLQMLAMTANIASPGISYAYRRIAKYLRWSLMGVKGNIPILDNAFSSGKYVSLPSELAVWGANSPKPPRSDMTAWPQPRFPPTVHINESSRPPMAPPRPLPPFPPLTPSVYPRTSSPQRTPTYKPINTEVSIPTYIQTYMPVGPSRIPLEMQKVMDTLTASPLLQEPQLLEKPFPHESTTTTAAATAATAATATATVPPSRSAADIDALYSSQMAAVPLLEPTTLTSRHQQRALASAMPPAAESPPLPPPPRLPPIQQSTSSMLNPGRDSLLAWLLRNVQELGDDVTSISGTSNSGSSQGDDKPPGSGFGFEVYVLGGAAAGQNEVVGLDATGQVLETMDGIYYSPTAAPPVVGNHTSLLKNTIETETQDLPYTLAIAALLMVGLVCIHALIILLYKWFIGGELAPFLRFPRMEIRIAGPLLVAITFYSCLILGQWEDSRVMAVLVLALLVLPYLLLLWWLTMCRWYLCEQPIQDVFYSVSANWNGIFRISEEPPGIPEIGGGTLSPEPANDVGRCQFSGGMIQLPEDSRPDTALEDVDARNASEGDNTTARKCSAMFGPHWALPPPADGSGMEGEAPGVGHLSSNSTLIKRPWSPPTLGQPSGKATHLRSPARGRASLTESRSLLVGDELAVGEGCGFHASGLIGGCQQPSPSGITGCESVEQSQQQPQQQERRLQHCNEITPPGAGTQMEGNLSSGACERLTSLQQNVTEGEEGSGMRLPSNGCNLPGIARRLQRPLCGGGVSSDFVVSNGATGSDERTKDWSKQLKWSLQEGDNTEAADGFQFGATSKHTTDIEEDGAPSQHIGALMQCRESERHMSSCPDSSSTTKDHRKRTIENPPILPSSSNEATSTADDLCQQQRQNNAQQEVKKEEDQMVHVQPRKSPLVRKKNRILVKFMNSVSRGGINNNGDSSGSGSPGESASDLGHQPETSRATPSRPKLQQLSRPISVLAASLHQSMVVFSGGSSSHHHQAHSELGKESERRVLSFSWRSGQDEGQDDEAAIQEDACSPFSTSSAQEPVIGNQRQLSPRRNAPHHGLGRTAGGMALSPMIVPRESVMERPDVANILCEDKGQAAMGRPRRPRLMSAAGFSSMGSEIAPSGQYMALLGKPNNNRSLAAAMGISINKRSNLLWSHGTNLAEEVGPAMEAELVAGPLAIRTRPAQLQNMSLSDPPLQLLHAKHRPVTMTNPSSTTVVGRNLSPTERRQDEIASLKRWWWNSSTFKDKANSREAKQMLDDRTHSALFLPALASAREPTIMTSSNSAAPNKLSRALFERLKSSRKHPTEGGAGSIHDDQGPRSSSFRSSMRTSSFSGLPNPLGSPRSRQMAWNDRLEPTGLQYMGSFSQMSTHQPANSAASDRNSGVVGSDLGSPHPSIMTMPIPAAFDGWTATRGGQEKRSDDENGTFAGVSREFVASNKWRRGPMAEATEGLGNINAPGRPGLESYCLRGVEIHDPAALGLSRPTVSATGGTGSVMGISRQIVSYRNHGDIQQSRRLQLPKHAKPEVTLDEPYPGPFPLDCATVMNSSSRSGCISGIWLTRDIKNVSVWWKSVRSSLARTRGNEYGRALDEAVEQGLQRRESHSYDTTTMAAPQGVDVRLLPIYPGKQLPMYRLHYKPGCWLVRLGIAPPVYFLAWFEFLFEEAIGEDKMQIGRETKSILSVWSVNTTHKALCAAVLGALGRHTRSALQIWLLVILYTAMLLYVILWRPYVARFVLVVELVCHAAMLVILGCGAGLLNSTPNNQAPTTYVMIVFFFLIAAFIIVLGLRITWLTIKGCWKARREQIKRQHTIERDSSVPLGTNEVEGRDTAVTPTAGGSLLDNTGRASEGADDNNYLAAATNQFAADSVATTANNIPCQLEVIPELPEIQSAMLTTRSTSSSSSATGTTAVQPQPEALTLTS
ncbi:hypothetical protein Vafri_8873 [Volvox africanus]|nr:hypothetical protein Vafri_8873 [Volvox africanus]